VVVGGGEGEEGKTAIETFTLNNSHDQKWSFWNVHDLFSPPANLEKTHPRCRIVSRKLGIVSVSIQHAGSKLLWWPTNDNIK
jgi:hypothetical protein